MGCKGGGAKTFSPSTPPIMVPSVKREMRLNHMTSVSRKYWNAEGQETETTYKAENTKDAMILIA